MKVLFISYFFEPFGGVGAKRMSYWAKHIVDFGIERHVITATEQDKVQNHITYIPTQPSKSWLRFFIKDPGLNWSAELRNYFEGVSDFNYDVVIISGGPFMHFDIGNFLKDKFGVKVVLDFRDPFSDNPSFNDGWLKRTIKGYFEKRFIKKATALIAVNKYCADLIVKNDKTIHIIDNGFNEKEFNIFSDKTENELPVIAHAGTFIQGIRSPEVFLKTMNDSFNGILEFHQFGKDSPYFDPYRDTPFFVNHGLMPYNELIKKLQGADICLLITEGKSFESTTKVFDYIGLNKKVLIITNGQKETGNLNHLTAHYPNVAWANNNPEDIQTGISHLLEMETQPFDSHNYSRAYSLEKLVALLKSL